MTEIGARLAKSRNVVDEYVGIYRVFYGQQTDGRPDCGEQIAKVYVGDWVRTYKAGPRPPVVTQQSMTLRVIPPSRGRGAAPEALVAGSHGHTAAYGRGLC